MLHPTAYDTSVSLQYGEKAYLIDMWHDVPSVGGNTVVYTEWAMLPKGNPFETVVPHLAACIGKMLDANHQNIPQEDQNDYSKQLHLVCALADKKKTANSFRLNCEIVEVRLNKSSSTIKIIPLERLRGGEVGRSVAELPMPEKEGEGAELAKRMIPILNKNLEQWLSMSKRKG